jgi:hypothetical protein
MSTAQITHLLTARKFEHPLRRRLLAAIRNYAECYAEDAGKGGADPTVVPLIEANLEGSLRRVHELVDKVCEGERS